VGGKRLGVQLRGGPRALFWAAGGKGKWGRESLGAKGDEGNAS